MSDDLHIIDEPVRDVLLPTGVPGQFKHNLSRSSTQAAWNRMLQCCLNPRFPQYPKYGGRGVKVCFKWMKFEGFLADVGIKPVEAKGLVRLDESKGFEPGNCVWR